MASAVSDELNANILVTGTPGVGKSHICQRIAEQLNLNWLDCSKIAKENNFLREYDEEYDCPVIDDDKLLDYLEPIIRRGSCVVEYHGCDFFPQRWFEAVFVVRCNNTTLYDRLKARNYSDKKLRSNIECEIFNILMDEALDAFKPEIVFSLNGETNQDSLNSVEVIKKWFAAFKRN